MLLLVVIVVVIVVTVIDVIISVSISIVLEILISSISGCLSKAFIVAKYFLRFVCGFLGKMFACRNTCRDKTFCSLVSLNILKRKPTLKIVVAVVEKLNKNHNK